MKIISIFAAAALMTAATGALAQKDKQPGGNVPLAQGPCAMGFEKSVKDGKMNLSDAQMKQVDTNSDGRISQAEFDAACSKKLFSEQDSKG